MTKIKMTNIMNEILKGLCSHFIIQYKKKPDI